MIFTMRKIYITLFFLTTVALVVAPLAVAAQTTDLPAGEAGLTEDEKLAQIAVQLEEIEQEVNRLTLLVTKLALEKQVADLQRQLAALRPQEQFVATVPAVPEGADFTAKIGKETASMPQVGGEDLFSQPTLPQAEEGKGVSRFAAALGPLGNLGKPELAALVILALLAMFVLARRLRGRKQKSEASTPVSQPPQDLLDEGRQELKENIVWK